MAISHRGVDTASMSQTQHPESNQIENLSKVEHHTHYRRSHHEISENRLLSGPGDVAVHQVGTGTDITLDLTGQPEAVVDVVKQVQKRDLDDGLDAEAQQVGPPEAPVFLTRVVVEPCVLAVLGLVFAFPLLPVSHVQYYHEGGTSDEDELKGPEANVGDGEEEIVADVGATWLAGVAVKMSLVVTPDPLSSHHEDHHSEDEDHGQPNASKSCGVFVHST